MKKRFFVWLCCGLILFLSGSYIFYPKKALSFSTALYSIQGEQILLPDWQQIAFSQFPPLTKSGSFLAKGIKRVWQQGQTPDQYLNLIDIQELPSKEPRMLIPFRSKSSSSICAQLPP